MLKGRPGPRTPGHPRSPCCCRPQARRSGRAYSRRVAAQGLTSPIRGIQEPNLPLLEGPRALQPVVEVRELLRLLATFCTGPRSTCPFTD